MSDLTLYDGNQDIMRIIDICIYLANEPGCERSVTFHRVSSPYKLSLPL